MKSIATIIRFTTIAISGLYTILLYLSGFQFDTTTKKLLALLPTVIGLLVVVYEKWIWRFPFIIKLQSRPYLAGLWKVRIEPDADSHIPEEGNRGPIEGYLTIEQTFWTISVHQYTKESESHSIASTFFRVFDSSQQKLSVTYDNTPKRNHIERSPRHVGACELNVAKGTPKSINGRYYTDRFTAGELSLSFVDRNIDCVDFKSAEVYVKEYNKHKRKNKKN